MTNSPEIYKFQNLLDSKHPGIFTSGIPGWLSGWASAFGSGRDPRVLGSSPASGSCRESASPLPVSLFLCLSWINKILKRQKSRADGIFTSCIGTQFWVFEHQFRFLFFFLKILFIYHDRHREKERVRDTGRGRIRLHAGAWCGTQSRVSSITPWAKGRH